MRSWRFFRKWIALATNAIAASASSIKYPRQDQDCRKYWRYEVLLGTAAGHCPYTGKFMPIGKILIMSKMGKDAIEFRSDVKQK